MERKARMLAQRSFEMTKKFSLNSRQQRKAKSFKKLAKNHT